MHWPVYLIVVFWNVFTLIIGLCQFFALVDGIKILSGMYWFIAAFLAFFIYRIPVIGTLLGMYGAVNVWDWSWLSAFLLYFGIFILILMFALPSTTTKVSNVFKR